MGAEGTEGETSCWVEFLIQDYASFTKAQSVYFVFDLMGSTSHCCLLQGICPYRLSERIILKTGHDFRKNFTVLALINIASDVS